MPELNMTLEDLAQLDDLMHSGASIDFDDNFTDVNEIFQHSWTWYRVSKQPIHLKGY